MPLSQAQQDTTKRDWLLPRDGPSDVSNKLDDRSAKAKAEMPRTEPRPNEIKEKPKEQESKQGKTSDKPPDKPPDKALPVWPLVVGAIVLAAFLALVVWIIFRPRPNVWTDDAYITVHYAVIAPRISGQVSTVQVDDNQPVKNGQVLVTLDPRDYETAVASAEATLARDSAQLADVSATLARQPSLISQQEAEVSSAQARLAFTEPDARRYQYLAATDAGTIQQRQLADSALQQSKAQLSNAQAALEAARRQLDVIKAQQEAAGAVVATDKAQLEQAKLNLSYTVIPAPVDGTVGERSVEVGNTVAPGTTLMTVVPLDSVYITANYREVDLAHVRSGQHATIHVDAYNIDIDGIVDSVAPASGISFAPIQPNNATGNFTKIVQRLPVKIVVSPNQPLAKLLRVGFSVETTIHTGLEDVVDEQRHSPSRVTEH
jgi:membrane fusion protein, multidrug efflux system